ncbi:hypothetical protein AX15_002549 [Amanita polypyramis BW_CC]|nr:hypothetical protein AX15_002549 [Amanita polypyramis BW_CC]
MPLHHVADGVGTVESFFRSYLTPASSRPPHLSPFSPHSLVHLRPPHSFQHMYLRQQRQLLPLVSGLLGTGLPSLPIPSISPILPLLLPPSSSSSSALSTLSSTLRSSTVSSSTTSSTPSSTLTPSTTAAPLTTSSVHVTTSGGRTITVVVDPTSSPSPIVPQTNSFLQNKTAEGVVFSLIGIIVLVFIFVFGTLAVRRRNRRKLVEQAISFDPGVINAERSSMDKASIRSSGSDPFAHQYGRPYTPPNAMAPRYPKA